MALNKTISISKFDVDPEGENLQLIIDCPVGYKFTSFIIRVYNKWTTDVSIPDSYDFSTAIISGTDTHYSVLIPLNFNSRDGIIIPSMYKIEAKAETTGTPQDDTPSLLTEAWTSDLRHMFDCMTASILNSDPCKGLPDEVIRQEVLLQGHLFALKSGRVEEALQYYKLVQNCGHVCNGEHVKLNPCNCGQ